MFSCSGAAEIADRAVRKVHRDGAAKMFCLAGIGGRVELSLQNTQAARSLVAVDGCDTDCAKRTLELAGLRVTDLGIEKGKTEVTSARIDMVAGRVRDALDAPAARADL